jgi:hypothetical protein
MVQIRSEAATVLLFGARSRADLPVHRQLSLGSDVLDLRPDGTQLWIDSATGSATINL